jgi:pimeloyl-ACP methyl ester carboxylesterase
MIESNNKESAFVVVEGVRLEVRTWPGKGLPILLLHEGLGSVAMWRDFPERLSRATGNPVIAWSRRGYGLSDPLPEARDPDYMHRESHSVAPLMDALAIDRVVLFGHSDGGSIALIAAARVPERVSALVLEAPHVYVEQLTVDSIAKVKGIYGATDLRERLRRYHRDPDHVFWRWNDIWLDPRFRNWSIEDLLPAVRAPALLIQGLDDEYGTIDQIDRVAAVLKDTQRLELRSSGHSPHRDQSQAVIDATVTFLESVNLGAGS